MFVLGGTRSGKSRVARDRARLLGDDRVTFVATARPGDPELDARIAAHRRDRPRAWATVDARDELAATLGEVDATHVTLLDSLTLWASSVLESGGDIGSAWTSAAAVIAARAATVVVVSDEVGLGVVPVSEIARRYRDELGSLHQRIAAQATTVLFCVAGVPLVLKGPA